MNSPVKASPEQLTQLLQVFNSIQPVVKGVEQYLLKNIYRCHLPKGKYLIRNGEVCDSIYFINKGLLRGFIKEKEKEITTWFALENELVAAISTFAQGHPTRENIQAIEDCELLAMKITDLDKLYQKYPSFNIVGRKVMELYYYLAENRAYITRLHDAEEKYELYLRYFSHFANRVQLTYVASFLGMSIETLSRVRSKKSLT
jgi:CRP-like cAMP-binding protein